MSYKKIIIIGNGSGVFEKENGNKIDNFDYVVRMGNCRVDGFEKYVGARTDMYRAMWCNLIHYNNETQRFEPRLHHLNYKHLLINEPDPDIYVERVPILHDAKRFYHLQKDIISGEIYNKMNFGIFHKHRGVSRITHDILLKFFIQKQNIEKVFFVSHSDIITGFKNVNLQCCDQRLYLPSNGILAILYMLRTRPNDEIYITGYDGFKTRYYWTTAVETSFRTHSSLQEQILLKKLLKEKKIINL